MQTVGAGRANTPEQRWWGADKLPVDPHLTEDGVIFSVTVERTVHECLVTTDALSHLSREHGFSMDAMNTYQAFEAKINSVARRLVLTGEHDAAALSRLVIVAQHFH